MTEDLPTPPLPLAIAKTLVREPGWAKGISRWAWPPRSVSCSPARCSALITPSWTSTPVTPGTRVTAAVTSRLMVSFSGQPGDGEQHGDVHDAGVVDLDGLDHAEVGDRPLDLRVVDGRQRGVDLLEGGGAHDSPV